MLNIITFDEFSGCHSLGQSVTGIALFAFWLNYRNIANNYSELIPKEHIHSIPRAPYKSDQFWR